MQSSFLTFSFLPQCSQAHSVFHDYFVGSGVEARRYNSKALQLIAVGGKVLTGYERMAIGGLEGYITMFAKPSASLRSIMDGHAVDGCYRTGRR